VLAGQLTALWSSRWLFERSRRFVEMSVPGGNAWNPPRDVSAKYFVLNAKARLQNWFFVNQDEEVKQQPDKPAVFQQPHIPEDQSLAKNSTHHRHVHRIPYITIESRDNQMARWKNRCRCAQPLHCESEERIQEASGSDGGQKAANKAERLQSQERTLKVPMGNPPRHQTGNEPRSDDQENRRTKDRCRLSNHVLM
jgi:hypothetical protein